MQVFDLDNTFMPTPLGLSVMDVNSRVCTNGVDTLRQENMMLVMEIEPIAEFKEWMEGRYGDQCDAWETSMYTAVMTANQNLLDTCINMRNDIMEEWYLLLVTMKNLQQSDTAFAGTINQSFVLRSAAMNHNPPSDLVTNNINVKTMPTSCATYDPTIMAS